MVVSLSLKLTQDASNYYQIENTDNYGAVEIAKYVNNVKVDSAAFSSEYTQGINYTITVTFSPASTTVEAFGDTLIMDNDATPITVNSFFVDTLQQDAFYDNIVYTTNPSEPPSNSAPVVTDDYVTLDENATVTINILQNDNDSDGSIDTDSINIISDVSHGTLSILSDGNVAYVPNSDFSGSDYFTYTVADDDGNISNIATVNITITPYIPASNNSTYTDDFSTDTTLEYSTEDTWTKGGTGNFNYDATGERAHVLTGNDVALAFSGDLTSSTEGSFSIDFLPVRYYPGGGVFILKLTQDANNFYQIENTDNYGAVEIAKYVNNVKVDSVAFSSEYTQGINYTITVTFSPASTTVEAFGDTLIMDNDATPITVNSFFVDTLQQDAFYDNIVYNLSSAINITTPQTGHIQTSTTLAVEASVSNLAYGWGVQFVLDADTSDSQVYIDKVAPYQGEFTNLSFGEHQVDAYIIDNTNMIQDGDENHDVVQNIAVGDIIVAIGDSITLGYGDDIPSNDVSLDGRNDGGGYTPILNDLLTEYKGYPHSVINEGLGSENTLEGLTRLPTILFNYPKASTYLILYGTNDSSTWAPLNSGKNLDIGDPGYTGSYKDYLQQMIDILNNAGKKIVIAKVPVVLGFSSQTGRYTEPIDDEFRNIKTREFNDVIDELISDPLNNITTQSPDMYTYYRNNYLNEYIDNLHPNGIGYNSMADLWANVLTD